MISNSNFGNNAKYGSLFTSILGLKNQFSVSAANQSSWLAYILNQSNELDSNNVFVSSSGEAYHLEAHGSDLSLESLGKTIGDSTLSIALGSTSARDSIAFDNLKLRGKSVSSIIMECSQGLAVNETLESISNALLTSPTLPTIDAVRLIDGSLMSAEDKSTLVTLVYSAASEGKITQVGWVTLIHEWLKLSQEAVNDNTLELDTTSPFVLQSFLSTFLVVLSQTLTAIISGIAWIISRTLGIIVSIVASLVDRIRQYSADVASNTLVNTGYYDNDYVRGPCLYARQTRLPQPLAWNVDSPTTTMKEPMYAFCKSYGPFDIYAWPDGTSEWGSGGTARTFSANMFMHTSWNLDGVLEHIHNICDYLDPNYGEQRLGYVTKDYSVTVSTKTAYPYGQFLPSRAPSGEYDDDWWNEMCDLYRDRLDTSTALCHLSSNTFATRWLAASCMIFLGLQCRKSADFSMTYASEHNSFPGEAFCVTYPATDATTWNQLYNWCKAFPTLDTTWPAKADGEKWVYAIAYSFTYNLYRLYDQGVHGGSGHFYGVPDIVWNWDLASCIDYIQRAFTYVFMPSAPYKVADGQWSQYGFAQFTDWHPKEILTNTPNSSAVRLKGYIYPQDQLICLDALAGNSEVLISSDDYYDWLSVTSLPSTRGWHVPDLTYNQLVAAEVITAGLVATAAAGAIIAKRAIRQRQFRKALQYQSDLNQKRDTYLADPNDDEKYNQFYTAVRRYNLKAKVFGWNTYDGQNNWFNAYEPGSSSLGLTPQNASQLLTSTETVAGLSDQVDSIRALIAPEQ